MSKRKHISQNTERLLWAMSAGRCEKCGRLIYQHPLSKSIGNFAQIAHNLPVSDNGPRSEYKQIDETKSIDDIKNLLLLCYDCHKEIDEIRPNDYPPELLNRMKSDFEQFIVKATNLQRIIPTIVLKYSPNLHGQRLLVSGIQNALFPDKVIEKELDITLKNSSFFVGDPKFWTIEEENLVRTFNRYVEPEIENYTNGFINVSVFAIAPIPLLVKLGELLSNKRNIDIYQLKKVPSTWEWETERSDIYYQISYLQEFRGSQKIIVIFSLSGEIKKDEVMAAISWDNSTVIEVKTNLKPYDDFLRSKKQLEKFIQSYQILREQLRKLGNSNTMVHIFAAVPISIAIEIGRQRNETFDLPLTIYNYANGAYEKAIVIGGIK